MADTRLAPVPETHIASVLAGHRRSVIMRPVGRREEREEEKKQERDVVEGGRELRKVPEESQDIQEGKEERGMDEPLDLSRYYKTETNYAIKR